MKRILTASILVVILVISIAGPVLADALWYATIRVTNTDGTKYNVSVPFTLNSQALIDNGYVESDFSDMAITIEGAGQVPFMPGDNSTNPFIMFMPEIGSSAIQRHLQTGGATGGKLAWFPSAVGGNVTDAAPLEPGNNCRFDFTIPVTADSYNITSKGPDFLVSQNNSVINVRATGYPLISSNTTGTSGGALVSGVGVTMPVTANGGRLIVVIATRSNPSAGTINTPAGWTQIFLTNYAGTSLNHLGAWYKDTTGVTATTNFTTTNPTGSAWNCFYLMPGTFTGAPTVGVTATGTSANPDPPNVVGGGGNTNYLWLALNGHTTSATTAAPAGYTGLISTNDGIRAALGTAEKYSIAASENPGTFTLAGAVEWAANTIAQRGLWNFTLSGLTVGSEVSASFIQDGTHAWITAGGVSSANYTALAIPNNTANWTWAAGAPYIYGMRHYVGGVLQAAWDWEYTSGNFTDTTGHGYGLDPTYRTTSSDPDVSAEITEFGPTSESKASTSTVEEVLPDIGTPDTPGEMYTTGDHTKIPGGDAADAMLSSGGVPYSLWWYPFIYFGICIIGLLIYGATQGPNATQSSNNPYDGSLLTMAIVMEALIVVFGIMNPVPLWPAYLFPIPAMAIIISRKHTSWG